jgi:hypothetical protein
MTHNTTVFKIHKSCLINTKSLYLPWLLGQLIQHKIRLMLMEEHTLDTYAGKQLP